ncbi:hypothetical protein ACHQM5_010573 [Ranunculus cassubicifolius]
MENSHCVISHSKLYVCPFIKPSSNLCIWKLAPDLRKGLSRRQRIQWWNFIELNLQRAVKFCILRWS